MSEDMTPIVRGAKYRDVSHGETHGDIVRVKSVWVDEDAETQVQVYTEDGTLARGQKNNTTVDLQSFIDRIDDTLIRVNTDHEAWEWRN
jgi:hypothetical protein